MNIEKLNKLADDIWGFAETGFEEEQSCKAMVDVLKSEGFTVEEGIAEMPTAYVATYGSGAPVISFLAEYDALTGMNQQADIPTYAPITAPEDKGHGCGHNLLGAGAIAAAIEYKEYLEENGLPGTVNLFGCPAEETGSGKAYLARDGYFKDSDVALTWHPDIYNQTVSGSSQSCLSLFFKFHGVSAHAAGNPHFGRSALDACEIMSVCVNYLREHMEDSDRVHYAYINAGGVSPNVVQSESVVKYFVRSTTNPKCVALSKRVIDCAKAAALATGTEVDVVFDEGLSNTIPNFVLEDVLENSFKKIYQYDYTAEEEKYLESFKNTFDLDLTLSGLPLCVKDVERLKKDVREMPICSYFVEHDHYETCTMGSTDVGDVSWVTPTAQINTACYSYGASAHSWQWVAQGKSSSAHKGYLLAGKVLADAAKTLYNDPSLIAAAKAEFDRRLDGQTYECLIPADVKPHISKV